jgi:ribonuclease E
VGQYLLNRKRTELTELENRHRATIDIIPRPEMKPNENKIDFLGAAAKNGQDKR